MVGTAKGGGLAVDPMALVELEEDEEEDPPPKKAVEDTASLSPTLIGCTNFGAGAGREKKFVRFIPSVAPAEGEDAKSVEALVVVVVGGGGALMGA